MKNNQLLLLLFILNLFFYTKSYSQGFSYDLSIGYGAHHGGFGGKLTVDNIFLIGIGVLESEPLVQMGFQYRFIGNDAMAKKEIVSSPYMAISYGGAGVQTETYSVIYQDEPYTEKKPINGFTILGGYLVRLGPNFFLETGVGYSFGGKAVFFEGTDHSSEYNLSTYTIDAALGYRF